MVSIAYLREVHDTVNAELASPIIKTYGDAFEVLEFLDTNKVVELRPLEGENGIFKIRKVDYSG